MANDLEVKQEENVALSKRSLTDADLLVIDSAPMYEVADSMLSEVHDFIKRVEAEFADPLKKASDALASIRALKNRVVEPAEIAKGTLRRKMGAYKEAERIRVATEEREAERRRQEEVAAAQAKLSETEEAFSRGEVSPEELARAEADVSIAEVGTAPMEQRVLGKASATEMWEVEVTSMPDLLEAIAADLRKEAPRFDNTIDIKVSQLKAYAKATNGKPLPGVRFTKKTSIRARS